MNCAVAAKNIAVRWLWLISLAAIIITPNGDGKNDFARITYYKPDGNFCLVRIYNLDGQLVADERVVNFQNKYPDIIWVWDGRDISGRIVPGGIYIYITSDGQQKHTGSILVVR